ncbi:hypothetical protein [Butyricimonas hominis]|uniref:hypothetical protein n=1 Tax=Butyricimonas hominis TaxID=2763032 RepID=UPI003512E588
MRKLAMIVGMCLLGMTTWAQSTKRVCDTIHYEFVQNKIIIPVTVNGVVVKYIVDTGGQTGTDWENVQKMEGVATGASNPISDLNEMKQLYQVAEVKDVQLSPNYKLSKMKTMVFPVGGLFQALGVAGILGGDAFAQSVVTFDAREQIMVINYPYRPERLKITDGVEMYGGTTHHSIVKMELGGVEKEVLFDTGADGFLLLNAAVFKEIEENGNGERVARGCGINGIGLEGLCDPVEIEKVNVKEMIVLGKKFTNVGSVISERNSTLVGVDLLKYGKVVIDYMRNRLYFFPFDSGASDMGGAPKTWNVGILPANERFEITTIWDSMKDVVTLGEQVIDINGTDITGFPMSQPVIDDLMNAIVEDTAYIIVLRDGKKEKIEIRRE